jgi:DUF2971 family protein
METVSMPPALYKYASAGRLKGLLRGTIRFTQATALNDPFEMTPIFDVLGSSENLLDEIMEEAPTLLVAHLSRTLAGLSPAERSRLPPSHVLRSLLRKKAAAADLFGQSRVLLRSLAADMLAHVREQMTSRLQSEIGILSLTDDPLSVTMWSHYADEHRGFALEFDPNHRWFRRKRSGSDEFYHLRKVRYLDLTAPGRTFLQVADENVLLTKGASWSNEREWRVLAPVADAAETLPQPGGPIYLFRFDTTAVRAIIFGLRTTNEFLGECIDLVKGNPSWTHVELKRIRSEGASLFVRGN